MSCANFIKLKDNIQEEENRKENLPNGIHTKSCDHLCPTILSVVNSEHVLNFKIFLQSMHVYG